MPEKSKPPARRVDDYYNESEDFPMDKIDAATEFLYGKREEIIRKDIYDKVKEYVNDFI